ncbi:hypothetical protein Kpol_1020p14 [Vanderwaltozyma polyspora DSM 70294]|uniref:Impact N-terminal domain-containing protein n=1 Tax=Vanderwaltozyma polyspora (strain ATCC 22028 / DSM 70294 / BCRC 21397 / CBS 2163 / NBRC 10782 / NRRL Y-8283 / UCD 57-17) TaxID=436907 RepID=A7TLC5_VANPO|nr:uncharacterized protein Kpol_1020p14 [Vanderwaltozyma polyspora DSM 70294]EDO16906.1 hypothetical protein Kpol_1020p14 [Vanderwaltozyma polyspora DSM 70294]
MVDWNESEVLVDRKSKFQARCCPLKNQDDIPKILHELMANKSIVKSSHPHMYAWRTADLSTNESNNKDTTTKGKNKKNNAKASSIIQVPKNIQQGCFDGGESGAGQRLLTLLERSNIFNVMIIVTRWYGGTPLGSARFRHISSTAVESLRRAGFLPR